MKKQVGFASYLRDAYLAYVNETIHTQTETDMRNTYLASLLRLMAEHTPTFIAQLLHETAQRISSGASNLMITDEDLKMELGEIAEGLAGPIPYWAAPVLQAAIEAIDFTAQTREV